MKKVNGHCYTIMPYNHAKDHIVDLSGQFYCDWNPTEVEKNMIFYERPFQSVINNSDCINYIIRREGHENGNRFCVHKRLCRKLSQYSVKELAEVANTDVYDKYISFDDCQIDSLDERLMAYSKEVAQDRRVLYGYLRDISYLLLDYKFTELSDDSILLEGRLVTFYEYCVCKKCGEYFKPSYETYANIIERKMIGQFIFNDKDKLKLTVIYKTLMPTANRGMISKITKDMVIFKKDTGKVYTILNHFVSGNEFAYHTNKKIVRDTTLCDWVNELNYKGSKQFLYLYKKYAEKMYGKEELKFIEQDLDYNKISLPTTPSAPYNIAHLKKRFGFKNTYFCKFLLNLRLSDPTLFRSISGMTEKEAMAYLKVNPKFVYSIYKNNEYYSDIYFALYGAIHPFITNIDNARKILLDGIYIEYKDMPTTKRDNFLYQYMKHNTETRAVNQLTSRTAYYLRDCIRLFKDIYHDKKSKKEKIEIDWSKSIKEIHDDMSNQYKYIKTVKRRIPKCKELQALDGFKIGNTIVRRAKTTAELVHVGSVMNICVGSYGELAVKCKCYIFVAYDENDVPVTCIELNKGIDAYGEPYFYVNQVKKKFNGRPDAEEASAYISMFVNNDVAISSWDLSNAPEYRKYSEELEERRIGRLARMAQPLQQVARVVLPAANPFPAVGAQAV